MKGISKAIKRTPHMLTTKVGMSSKSNDAETDELVRKFSGLEDYTTKLIKDTGTFRDAINTMLVSQVGFGDAFSTIFQPILSEQSLTSKYPDAANTLRNIAAYGDMMGELRDAIQPELELLDSRVTAPLKEYQELVKKIRKTITKREHKLLDYDRHNNSYTKLKDKKEKSLSDEKNLFKLEQDLELATEDYEHYNSALKNEVPHFLALTTAFIAPLFQTFYFVKVGILYTLLEKMQAWAGQTYGDLSVQGLEAMHQERIGDTVEQLDALTVTKRYAGSARTLAAHRQNSGTSSLGRAPSTASSYAARPAYAASPAASTYSTPAAAAAPPPYSGGAPAGTALAGKRPAPPPPAPRPKANALIATALYDYAGQAGDLSFSAGDKIEVTKRTESSEDWWEGKLQGAGGPSLNFPANYVQL